MKGLMTKHGKSFFFGLMSIDILLYLYLLMIGAEVNNIPGWLWLLRLLAVPFSICFGKLWKDKCFWILAAYFCWFTLRLCLPSFSNLFTLDGSTSIFGGLWLFCGCYGFGKFLVNNQSKKTLLILLSAWIVGMVIYSCVGIYTAWEATWIDNPFGAGAFHVGNGRLNMIYLATTAGEKLSIAALISIIGVFGSSVKWYRKLSFFSMLSLVLALVLTDSRTAYISLAVGVSIIIISRTHILLKNTNIKKWKNIAICIPEAIAVVVIIFLLLSFIASLFNQIRVNLVISPALAESNEYAVIKQRNVTNSTDIFTGRFELWVQVLKYLKHHPLSLLIGESKINPLGKIDMNFAHCHSVYLQILLESGIPGFLMVLAFITIIGKKGIRTVTQKDVPLWITMIPALAFSLLVGDLAECYLWIKACQCEMSAFLFLSCGIISASSEYKCDLPEY